MNPMHVVKGDCPRRKRKPMIASVCHDGAGTWGTNGRTLMLTVH